MGKKPKTMNPNNHMERAGIFTHGRCHRIMNGYLLCGSESTNATSHDQYVDCGNCLRIMAVDGWNTEVVHATPFSRDENQYGHRFMNWHELRSKGYPLQFMGNDFTVGDIKSETLKSISHGHN